MKKKCVVCGREFEACGNGKLCSVECRNKRECEQKSEQYSRNAEQYRANRKKYYREHYAACLEYNRHYNKYQRRRGDSERDYERRLAAELAYWNYLIAKYPGGAKCK